MFQKKRVMANPDIHPSTPTLRRQVVCLSLILTLAVFSAILHQSSRVYLYQQTQCIDFYRLHDPSQIRSDSQVDESLCKLDAIQSRLAITDGIDSFLSCIPSESIPFPSALIVICCGRNFGPLEPLCCVC